MLNQEPIPIYQALLGSLTRSWREVAAPIEDAKVAMNEVGLDGAVGGHRLSTASWWRRRQGRKLLLLYLLFHLSLSLFRPASFLGA